MQKGCQRSVIKTGKTPLMTELLLNRAEVNLAILTNTGWQLLVVVVTLLAVANHVHVVVVL